MKQVIYVCLVYTFTHFCTTTAARISNKMLSSCNILRKLLFQSHHIIEKDITVLVKYHMYNSCTVISYPRCCTFPEFPTKPSSLHFYCKPQFAFHFVCTHLSVSTSFYLMSSNYLYKNHNHIHHATPPTSHTSD